MICCDNLIHPFQNDPGVSQRQRVIEDLLSGSAKIDGRSMADLLDYFVQLSHHINYYDSNLLITDWSAFFKGSFPFLLSGIIKYKKEKVQNKFDKLNRLFDKHPSRQSLQLLVHFVYFNTIYRVNEWHTQLKESELKAATVIEKLIKDKLKKNVKIFVCLTNNAVQKHQIKKLDFSALRQNDAWGFTNNDWIDSSCFNSTAATKRKRLIALRNKIAELFPIMLNSLSIASSAAELSMDESLLPVKEEFQKNHPPHLALLFAFLKLFKHLQSDLNSYTKKHLDFFYQKVLQLKPREATADKAHVLFEIQKELDKYLVKKGVQVKDGKDIKKAEINFALKDEIVVNKTAVGDVKTLFFNNKTIHDTYYLEGAYIAPDARKADGVKIDFTDDPKNWPTLGAKYSKYIDPEKKTKRPCPAARLGFILSSPVLLLNEGTRTINIQLACVLDKKVCDSDVNETVSDPCCGSSKTQEEQEDPCQDTRILPIDPEGFIDDANQVAFNDTKYGAEPNFKIINKALKQTYCFISQQLLEEAEKKGISKDIITLIKKKFLLNHCYIPFCCADAERYLPNTLVRRGVWRHFINKYKREERIGLADDKILEEIFPPRRPFKIYFSGEKEWIQPKPSEFIDISMTKAGSGFLLNIAVKLQADQPAITFYNKEKLKEDFGTESPLVKIEFDNELGLRMNKRLRKLFKLEGPDVDECCLFNKIGNCLDRLSFYHFFKYVRIIENLDVNPMDDTNATKIYVKVCGLKNFIVQNESSLQDVNSPIYVFEATPHVGSHFYIGCEEIFLKKWINIGINHTWKDIPPISKLDPPLFGTRFRAYYNGYQDFFITSAVEEHIILDEDFQMEIAIRQDGEWRPWKYGVTCEGAGDLKSLLFQPMPPTSLCLEDKNYEYQYVINRIADFPIAPNNLDFPKEKLSYKGLKKFTVDARQSFIRITLKCQDFQHDKYPFILARQMAALGKLPDILDGAVYFGVTLGTPPHFTNLNIPVILNELQQTAALSSTPPGFDLDQKTINLVRNIIIAADPGHRTDADIQNIWDQIFTVNDPSLVPPGPPIPSFSTGPFSTTPSPLDETHSFYYDRLHKILDWLRTQAATIHDIQDKGVVIPNPPWVPIMSSIALDYDAVASIGDIDLTHLHPYEGTYEQKEIELKPTLFPTFCDEGNLFIGLKGLVPGNNLNMLFQLAEATADSESEREELKWHYLDNNQWKSLRDGFEVLEDATDGLTTSGIVKFATPENMTNENTIMPKGMHWIKASIIRHSSSVSETIGIHPQAIQVVFTNTEENDKLRLDTPLVAKSLSKLTDADANIKKVEQPYDSFGGREPEVERHYYLRVSELLRHKGRAIQKWDYEHIVLESFPQIYRTKCINHSYALNAYEYINDFPVAPGYVLLAVIPDLTKLKAGNSFEPKAPVSLIEEITKYVRKRTSPFVRFRVMNPRYEKIDFCLKVKLYKGRDENYYKEKLAEDLRNFLAPWAIGDYDKLKFGQCVNRSDLLRFLEGLDYLDYVIELKMKHERDGKPDAIRQEICPKTPRSILFAGEIDICIPDDACDEWEECLDASGKSKCCDKDPIPVVDYCSDKKIRKIIKDNS